jgi:hypothetical protein
MQGHYRPSVPFLRGTLTRSRWPPVPSLPPG